MDDVRHTRLHAMLDALACEADALPTQAATLREAVDTLRLALAPGADVWRLWQIALDLERQLPPVVVGTATERTRIRVRFAALALAAAATPHAAGPDEFDSFAAAFERV